MKHRRILVLNGLRRGGTSIVWNILESHPGICSPLEETGQLIYPELLTWLPELATKLVVRTTLTRSWAPSALVRHFDDDIQRVLWERKRSNLEDPDNKYKYEGEPYLPDEIDEALLCLKSVNLDTFLVDYFARFYENARFIGLIRNGYAILNGAMRRGDSAEKVGRDYRRVGQKMIQDERERSDYMLLKFEDVLAEPFEAAARLFEFAGVAPVRLDKLRLKSKRVLSPDGQHEVRFGEEDRKYWFGPDQIWSILDKDVNKTQVDRLSSEDLHTFERHAGPVLDHFGYSIRD